MDDENQNQRRMRRHVISDAMIELQARHASDRTTLEARHQNERAKMAIKQDAETKAQIEKERPAEPPASK